LLQRNEILRIDKGETNAPSQKNYEMPAAFDRCVRKGGRVRTTKRTEKTYRRICYYGGKSYAGEEKRVKMKRGRGSGGKGKK